MVERVAVSQRAMLAPTSRSSGGPSDRFVLCFMQLRDVVSSFGVVFRLFFWLVSIYTVRVAFSVVSCNLCRARSVAMWTFGHILQALDVVFFIRSMFILGLFNIGGLEPGVSCLLIFGFSARCAVLFVFRIGSIGATKFGLKPSQRRAWTAMGSVEEGN